jgi:hypothetical protein
MRQPPQYMVMNSEIFECISVYFLKCFLFKKLLKYYFFILKKIIFNINKLKRFKNIKKLI